MIKAFEGNLIHRQITVEFTELGSDADGVSNEEYTFFWQECFLADVMGIIKKETRYIEKSQ